MFKQIIITATLILATSCSLQKSGSLSLDPSAPPGDGESGSTSQPVGRDPALTNEELLKLKVSELSYRVIEQQVLLDRCVGCHSESGGNKGDINLETYESVFENKELVRAEVFAGTMPPKRRPELKLNEGQIKVILDWIDNGAKKELDSNLPTLPAEPPVVVEPVPVAPTPAEPPPVVPPVVEPPGVEPPQPVVAYFADVFEKVIQTNCLKCHSSSGEEVSFETYQDVFGYRNEIFNEVISGSMPPKRRPEFKLTDEQKALLLDWIKNGAPEKAP